MDYLILAVGALGSGLCEYMASALFSMPASVIATMAEEGSDAASRVRAAMDEHEEARLSISIVDVAFLVLTTASVASLTLPFANSSLFLIDMLVLISAVVLIKTVAAVIGARFWDRMLRGTSLLLGAAIFTARPFIWLHRLLMKIARPGDSEDDSREELEALVETAREEGALDPGEYRIMTNIMKLSSIEVSDVMTPRMVVYGANEDTTISDVIKQPELQMYSRFPVFDDESLDSVSGYVMTKDVLRAALAGRHAAPISKLKRDVDFIPENISLDQALELFLQKKQHLLMVVDEYGGVEGLLTLEDVMETMLGVEIVDEADHVVDLRALAKQRRDERIARQNEASTTTLE